MFDVASALRWSRFEGGRTRARRDNDALPFASPDAAGGSPLLLDTCVYIDQMQSGLPDFIQDMLEARVTGHSTVAIQELMHAVGVLDPKDGRTAGAIAAIRSQIEIMPEHRINTADADTLGRSALLSGILCRLQGYARDDRCRALQDCTLFLQAQKLGLTLLTRNIADFDILLQLIPDARVLFYRKT